MKKRTFRNLAEAQEFKYQVTKFANSLYKKLNENLYEEDELDIEDSEDNNSEKEINHNYKSAPNKWNWKIRTKVNERTHVQGEHIKKIKDLLWDNNINTNKLNTETWDKIIDCLEYCGPDKEDIYGKIVNAVKKDETKYE